MSEDGVSTRSTIVDVVKTILASPVGGWALAVIAIGLMAYHLAKERAQTYGDLAGLRAQAMPLIIATKELSEDNHKLLQEILERVKKDQLP